MIQPENFYETVKRYYEVTRNKNRKGVIACLGGAATSAALVGAGLGLARQGYGWTGELPAAYFSSWVYIFTRVAKDKMMTEIEYDSTLIH